MRVERLGLRIRELGLRVEGLGLRDQGLGLRDYRLGLRVSVHQLLLPGQLPFHGAGISRTWPVGAYALP